jgi:hypothetical protein
MDRSRRPALLQAAILLVIGVFLIIPTRLGAQPVPPSNSAAQEAPKKVDPEKAQSSALKDWLPVAGTVAAAVIAGLFGVYQLRRSTSAQRALEREKLVTARTEAELAQVQSSTREYRQAQALPFLEQLDKTLVESYAAAYMIPYFPKLGANVPELRRFADRALADWLVAMKAMYGHRIRLLLVLSGDRVEIVASLLTRLGEQARQIIEARNNVWFQQASEHDLWEAQRL